jgi:hypothetical protein
MHMHRPLLSSLMIASLLFGMRPAEAHEGHPEVRLIKSSGPAVYYAIGDKRYVFPNEKVYFSWYGDFNQVVPVSDAEMASFLIGGNITYRPGTRMVKIQSDPKVYAVTAGGTLRWIASEEAAKGLYGDDWNKKVDDVSDAFFFNYRLGESIMSASDIDSSKDFGVADIAEDLARRAAVTVAAPQQYIAFKTGLWSDTRIWNDERVPRPGSDVTIPANVAVTYDADLAEPLASLDVKGSLRFSEEKSARLAARAIAVSGTLAVGSVSAPLRADLASTIALSGNDGLRVEGGRLELYGSAPTVAWTRLAAAAMKGEKSIVVTAPTAWPAGGEIMITSSTTNSAETEVRKIALAEGSTITLDAPLSFNHAVEAGIAPEVALLSRNVRLTGGTVAISAGGRLSAKGVEFRGNGLSGIKGRTPIAFASTADAAGSLIQADVIRESNNRCLDIDRVSGLRVEDTVAFDVRGSCFVALTGAETELTFKRNLVARVKADSGDAYDLQPAAFIVRNPTTVLEGNAVAGSAAHGYWYDLPNEATKTSGGVVRPREAALGAFKDNSVRAAAKSGLFVDDAGGKMNYTPSTKAVFSGFRASLSGDYGFWLRGSNVEVSGALLAGNRVGGSFAAFAAIFKDSTVLGNLDSASSTPTGRYGFVFDEGPVSVANVAFRNFVGTKDRRASAFAFPAASAALLDSRNSLRSIGYLNARKWHQPDPATVWDKLAAARDLDSGKIVTAKSDFLADGCVYDAGGNIQECPGPYAPLEIALRDITEIRDLVIERSDGKASVTMIPGQGFDGVYGYATVKESGDYRLIANNAGSFGIDYQGSSKPVTIRVRTTDKPQVTGATSWKYDPVTGETAVTVAPQSYVSIIR